MIVASSGQIAAISGHDHGTHLGLGGSLASAAGECVEVLRSAMLRLRRFGARVTSG